MFCTSVQIWWSWLGWVTSYHINKLRVDTRMDREVHGRIHRQMQATAIPKGQNWPQIKMIRKKNGWSKMYCVHQFESKYRGNTAVSLIRYHYDDVIMSTKASQITSLTIVYSTIYSGTDQSKHQSSASLAFVWGIHRGLVNSPHKWPVTRKMFPFDDVIMTCQVINMPAALCFVPIVTLPHGYPQGPQLHR